MTPRILVLTANTDGQAKGLTLALRELGCHVVATPLAALAFDTSAPAGLAIPGFAERLPDAAVVRSVAAGSFEAVTRRLGVLHALERLSVPVWNPATVIERCVDKSMTTFLLQRAGLPTPPTFAVEGRMAAEAVAARALAAGPLVLKPLFGAQGRGIRLVRTPADLPSEEETAGVYYLQHYVERSGPPFRDYRVLVCAGAVLAMMERHAEGWITNIGQGGIPRPVSGARAGELSALALEAAAAVGAAFAGVDIVEAADGSLLVLEVNSMPAWAGLQSVAPIDIAGRIAAALVGFLAERQAVLRPAPPPGLPVELA